MILPAAGFFVNERQEYWELIPDSKLLGPLRFFLPVYEKLPAHLPQGAAAGCCCRVVCVCVCLCVCVRARALGLGCWCRGRVLLHCSVLLLEYCVPCQAWAPLVRSAWCHWLVLLRSAAGCCCQNCVRFEFGCRHRCSRVLLSECSHAPPDIFRYLGSMLA